LYGSSFAGHYRKGDARIRPLESAENTANRYGPGKHLRKPKAAADYADHPGTPILSVLANHAEDAGTPDLSA
jgi:hypothetical protein